MGSGKTTLADQLLGELTDPVVLDADILWGPEMDTPSDGYARLRSTWMRVAANIAQSGRSTLLVGAGVPEQFEVRPERRYVGDIHWLALVPADEVLEERLRTRPTWRGVNHEVVTKMLAFNDHLRARADMAKIDTGRQSLEQSGKALVGWLRSHGSGLP